MAVVCLGLSYHTAPVEVREQHALDGQRKTEALIALRDYEAIAEAAILSTCGRLELYAEMDDVERGIAQLKQFLANFRHGGVPADMERHLYALQDRDAVEHVFRVATGLDSMLIGEAEILGQVKAAYDAAQRAGSLGPALHHLFRAALGAGKAARSSTTIGGASVSVATAAIACAKERLGTFRGKHVVLIGAGKMGATAAKRLALEGADRLVVVNRTHERAHDLVTRLRLGQAAELLSLGDALAQADVVMTSTGASHFILTPGNVAEAMLRRLDRPLLVVDIAVPRDVAPGVSAIPGVTVVGIDELGVVIDRTLAVRREAIPLVERLIAERLCAYEEWCRERATVPVIASLARKAEAIREAEIGRLFTRCPALDERERTLITGASLSIVSKLLHSAIARLREKAAAAGSGALDEARVLDELFDLRSGDRAP
jgi:glutamyl-tRNA reductase